MRDVIASAHVLGVGIEALGARAPAWLAEWALPGRLVGAAGNVEVVGGWPAPEGRT